MKTNRKTLSLTLILAVLLSLTASVPALAQEPAPNLALDATLAQAAAKSFLVTLTRPELAATQSFYLLEDVPDANFDTLAQLKTEPVTGFQLTQSGWLDETFYQVTASLQPGNRSLLLTTVKLNGRWRVAELHLVQPSPAATSSSQAQPSRQPASTGLPGQLVFQTHSGGDIYFINADGSGLRRLTHGLDPQLSPDGSRVAFTRWEPEYELFTINTDGSGETAWASGWRQMKSPTWSADGARLVVSYQSGGRLEDEIRRINLVNAARNEQGVRVPAQARDVELEGDTLSYRLPMDAHWYLLQVDLTSGQLDTLPAGQYAYSPTWHPTDPNRLLYTVGSRGIALYDAQSQAAGPVTTDGNDRAPVLSPDGSRVAVSYNQSGHWEVHTFNLDGSHRQRLTETPLSVLAERTVLQTQPVAGKERVVAPEQPNWNNAAPAWSPDGLQLAFMTDRTGRWEMWLMNADGSNQRPMFPNGQLDGLTFHYNGVDERMLSWQ
jgi:Tol biopolymer transport system component